MKTFFFKLRCNLKLGPNESALSLLIIKMMTLSKFFITSLVGSSHFLFFVPFCSKSLVTIRKLPGDQYCRVKFTPPIKIYCCRVWLRPCYNLKRTVINLWTINENTLDILLIWWMFPGLLFYLSAVRLNKELEIYFAM